MAIRFLVALLAMLMLGLSVQPTSATSYTFETVLAGANEDPPVASPATGFARVVLDTAAHRLDIHAEFEGLLGMSTAAHIHAPSLPFFGNAPVAVQLPTLNGFPAGVTEGVYEMSFDTLNTATYTNSFITTAGGSAEQAEALLLQSLFGGQAYLNIHTTEYGAGEIRGFFRPPAPIPLPAGLPLLLAAVGGLALLPQRHRG